MIANDFVPLEPYTTDSVLIGIGQRYDVVVTGLDDVDSGDYWLRGGWVTSCSSNLNAAGMLGIIRYDSSSTADPTTSSNVTETMSCGDEPYESLVPYLALDVGTLSSAEEAFESLSDLTDSYFKWMLNSSSLYLNWSDPTLVQILNGDSMFPTDYNDVGIDSTNSSATDEWALLIIEDDSGTG